MKKKYNENDYLYASARIRALENTLIGPKKMAELAACNDTTVLARELMTLGYSYGDFIYGQIDKVVLSAMKDAEASVPDKSVYRAFRRPYDCHNVKTAIKSQLRGRSRDDALRVMSPLGLCDVERLLSTDSDTAVFTPSDELPQALKAASLEALEVYHKTQDPQAIDLICDRACFADMIREAEESKVPTLIEWVRLKADLCNISSCARILKMKETSSAFDTAYLKRVLVEGGSIKPDKLCKLFEEGRTALADYLAKKYPLVSLDDLDATIDAQYLDSVANAKYKLSGADIPAAYVIAKEYEAKNLRIVIANATAGKMLGTVRV